MTMIKLLRWFLYIVATIVCLPFLPLMAVLSYVLRSTKPPVER